MCGEHEVVQTAERAAAGSSPHVRGARDCVVLPSLSAGIIPACAGSTLPKGHQNRQTGDHPRMCGEHYMSFLSLRIGAGSSPHVRGALPLGMCLSARTGIIPACAGSTSRSCRSCVTRWDHPRMCGEHSAATRSYATGSGSSPHVRGAPARATSSISTAGIIPACAGSTACPHTIR